MRVAIAPLDPLSHRDELHELYCAAARRPLDDARARAWRDAHLPRHATRPDFAFLVAGEPGDLLGFAYGYTGARGEWWTERVAAAMEPGIQAAWIDVPHFEVVELHVRPDVQRRGIGRALLDALLAAQPHDRALLTTQEMGPGRPFYERLGWRELARVRLADDGPPMLVLGRDEL